MKANLIVSIVLVTVMFVTPLLSTTAIDLHRLWDNRCADCHGHSGDFARQFLSVSGDKLQGWHHIHDLRRFLRNHYLAGKEVDEVYNMLRAQTISPPRFKDECSSCHKTAAGFVREVLVFDGDALISRVSGNPVRGFLEHHGNLEPADVEFFVKLLTRVAHEVHGP